MANRRMISKTISTSERVNDCTIKTTLLFTWLIPHCDDWGRMAGSPRKIKAIVVPMREDLGGNEVDICLQELKARGLIHWWRTGTGEMILEVVDWWDHQTISEKKRAKSKYPAHSGDKDKPQESPGKPKKAPPKRTKENLTKEKLTKENEVPQNCIDLAKDLAKAILFNNPNLKTKIDKWPREIDRMMRIDNHEEKQIRWIINHIQEDDFWSGVVLSATGLRKHFDKIVAQVRAKHKKAKAEKPTGRATKEFKSTRKPVSEEQRAEYLKKIKKISGQVSV